MGHEKDKSRASGVCSETQGVKRKEELCPCEKAITFVFHPSFPKSPLSTYLETWSYMFINYKENLLLE